MKDGKEKLNLPITKPKTLHELLKQGSGHNLVLDFSMLSKRGGLIEKAKKYQNINNQKIQSEIINNDKTKISKNFEILSKLGKKKKKNENINHFQNKEINIINNNIQNELINDFNNKINISKKEIEQDNYENNNNDYISQECLELRYDNPQSDSDKEEKEEKNKLNNKNIKIKKDNDIIKKRKKKNINNYIKNIEIETNSLNDDDNPNTPQILNYSTYTIPEYNQNYNQNKLNNKFHRPFVITKSPNFENEENYYYNNNNNNSIYRSNKKTKKSFLKNQVIEYETIKESYTIKQCNCVLEYSFREDQNIDSETLMEDKSKSIENFNNDKNQMVFEIFDGHGGDEMSTYLQHISSG